MTTGDPKGFRFRESTRAPFKTQVQLRFEKDGEETAGFSANVSMEGLFVETNDPRPVGTLVQFEFDLEGQSIQGLGDVVWIRTRPLGTEKPPGMGVQFRYIDPQSRDLVFRIVDRYLKESKDADSSIPAPGSGMPVGGAIGAPPVGETPVPSAPQPGQVPPTPATPTQPAQAKPPQAQPKAQPAQPQQAPPQQAPPQRASEQPPVEQPPAPALEVPPPASQVPPQAGESPPAEIPGAPQEPVRLDPGEIAELTQQSGAQQAGPEASATPAEPSLSGLPDSIDLSRPAAADSSPVQDDLEMFELEDEAPAPSAPGDATDILNAPLDVPTVSSRAQQPFDLEQPQEPAFEGVGSGAEQDSGAGRASSREGFGFEEDTGEGAHSSLSSFDINEASSTVPNQSMSEPEFAPAEPAETSGYFEEMIAQDERKGGLVRMLVPVILILGLLGVAGYFLKDRVLGLFGGSEDTPTEIAQSQPTEDPDVMDDTGRGDDSSATTETGLEDPIDELETLGDGFDDEFEDANAGDGFLDPDEDLNDDFSDDGFDEGFEDEPAAATTPPPAAQSRPQPRQVPPAPTPRAGMSINSISTATAADGTVVTVDGSRDLAASAFSVLRLDGPPRLLVRVSGVTSPHDSQGIRAPEFASVRSGLHDTPERGSELHLVFDLTAANVQADSEVVAGNLVLRFRQN